MNNDKIQRLSGIPCPSCNSFIPLSLNQILNTGNIFCPYCGLKLNIDNKPSDKIKEILEKIDKMKKEINEHG